MPVARKFLGMLSTADLCDEFRDEIQVIGPGLSHFGRASFAGLIETVSVREDNSLVKATLSTFGDGRVLVVDGGAIPVALVGDKLAAIAIESGWSGIVVNGYVRDTEALQNLPLGVMALGTFPRRSFLKREGERGGTLEFL